MNFQLPLDFPYLLWYDVVLAGGECKMDVIDELFAGEVYGAERPAPDTPEYHEAIRKADESYRRLIATFNEKQLELFEQYQNDREAVSDYYPQCCFRYGMQLGARLLKAMLLDDGDDRYESEKDE